MTAIETYIAARDEQIKENIRNKDLEIATHHFFEHLVKSNYVKNFTWRGVPILQLPSDLMVIQELLWTIKPDWIIETGTAFGGSAIFYASVFKSAWIITIDKKMSEYAYTAIENSSLPIWPIEGDSVAKETVLRVKGLLPTRFPHNKIMVSLDSHHTHDHVLQELRLYSPLVSVGSYVIVFDTTIETYGHFDPLNNKRPWGKGNNPATAVKQFLSETDDFVVDKEIEQRALITAAPGGWLKRIK